MSESSTGSRRWLKRCILLLLGTVAGLVFLEVLFRVLTVKDPDGQLRIGRTKLAPLPLGAREAALAASLATDTYLLPDPGLGWALRPGGHDSKLGLYHANSLGLRSLPREDPVEPGPGVTRVLAVGDSFTHCDQVKYEESWTHFLEAQLGLGFEVLNGGVPGYGTDQAFLRWRALGPKLKPRVVVLGILLEDVFRNVNIFRTFEYAGTSFPFSKPRFVIEGDGIGIINSPVIPPSEIPSVLEGLGSHPLGKLEYWYLPDLYEQKLLDVSHTGRFLRSRLLWRERSQRQKAALGAGGEGLKVTARIAARFCAEVREGGGEPIVAVIPSQKDLAALKAGARPWDALLAELRAAHAEPIVDLSRALLESLGGKDPASYYVDGVGHLSGAGNLAVAKRLAPEIKSRAGR